MPSPMLNLRTGRPVGLGRNHDYNAIYEADQPGQQASENARVWRVYLDEADAYDTDMISSFQTILDSLLVFASLFSAIVTTFVSQTSQVLQPDNAQITVSLLVETNQLLRAAGNSTKIDSISPSTLGPNSPTHSSTDLWINGLFFTSLTLSVATALLSVLSKQWIQAYIQIVSGTAKTQSMIRQFRFDGLKKWKLRSIIEGLPIILHTSVAIFLIGLSLYVSQLSRSICAILSSITALTFLFYLVTSMIPAFSVDCPFRLSSMFSVARSVQIVAHAMKHVLFNLLARIIPSVKRRRRLLVPFETLRKEEYREAVGSFEDRKSLLWLFEHSTNNSTKDIVVEGVSGILDQLQVNHVSERITASLLSRALLYSAHRQNELQERSKSDDIIQSTWSTFINKVLLAKPRLAIQRATWEHKIFQIQMWKCYVAAWRSENLGICKYCLSLLHGAGMETIRKYVFRHGNQNDIRCAMDVNTRDIFLRRDGEGATVLHDAATWGNLEAVIALLDTHPELIDAQTLPPLSQTALECAVDGRIVEYLLDRGARATPSTLHLAATFANAEAIVPLLDRGWDRTVRDKSGATPIDLARKGKATYDPGEFKMDVFTKKFIKIIDYLENYQTAPLPHQSMVATLPTTSEHGIPPNALPLGQTMTVDNGLTGESGNQFNQSLEIEVILRDEETSVKAETGVEPLAEGLVEMVH